MSYQTNTTNSNDGDCFIAGDGTIGVYETDIQQTGSKAINGIEL
jgi:hypothetical protein